MSATDAAAMDDDLARGIAAHKAGRAEEAARCYRAVLAAAPGDARALHLLGLLQAQGGAVAEGLALIRAAVERAPGLAAAQASLGQALALAGRVEAAEAAYCEAWRLAPDACEVANNLGCLARDRGDTAAAEEWFWQAAQLAPDHAVIALNLALAQAQAGRLEAALMQFEHVLLLQPECAAAHGGIGRLLVQAGKPAAAEARLRRALALRPGDAGLLVNLGVALEAQGRSGAASFRDALRCDPDQPDAHCNLGAVLRLENRADEAVYHHQRALAADPLHGKALWARCMAELPVFYETEDEIALRRARYDAALTALCHAAEDAAVAAALEGAIGSLQPFFLPYQGFCDRALQARYGALLGRLVSRDPAIDLARDTAGRRRRIAIVTGFACEHTVWRLITKGWLSELDRSRFEVTLYHTGSVQDGQTEAARQLAERYRAGGLAAIRAALIADRPDAVLYPEIGIDPVCARLAVERFAPLQCVGWGHPQTTGLGSIDVFLSSAAMEPPDGAAHYTERLVALPGLGVRPMLKAVTLPPLDQDASRAELGLRAGAVVFWCGQAIFKYLPQHDAVLARIAAMVPDCQFVFIGFAKSSIASARFMARVGRAFSAAGLDPARSLVMLPPMGHARFVASAAASDIVLDSLDWSGGKSTLDVLAAGRPVVTLAGALMRGRHGAGILRLAGVTETIAADLDDYVRIAVALAGAPALRAALGARLAQAAEGLVADAAPVRALEALLLADDAMATETLDPVLCPQAEGPGEGPGERHERCAV